MKIVAIKTCSVKQDAQVLALNRIGRTRPQSNIVLLHQSYHNDGNLYLAYEDAPFSLEDLTCFT